MTVKRLVTSCFGLGWLPGIPGTFGSLPPAVAFGLIYYFYVKSGAQASPCIPVFLVMLAFLIAGSVVCIKFSDEAIAATGKSDPREIVADEVAGQALTFIIQLFLIDAIQFVWGVVIITAGGIVLFRLFDIIKPWPIRCLEKLPVGWGILVDDLMAGVYAGVVLVIAAKFLLL